MTKAGPGPVPTAAWMDGHPGARVPRLRRRSQVFPQPCPNARPAAACPQRTRQTPVFVETGKRSAAAKERMRASPAGSRVRDHRPFAHPMRCRQASRRWPGRRASNPTCFERGRGWTERSWSRARTAPRPSAAPDPHRSAPGRRAACPADAPALASLRPARRTPVARRPRCRSPVLPAPHRSGTTARLAMHSVSRPLRRTGRP